MLWNLRDVISNVHALRLAPQHAYRVAEKISTEVWDIYLQAGIGLLHTLAHSHTCLPWGRARSSKMLSLQALNRLFFRTTQCAGVLQLSTMEWSLQCAESNPLTCQE